MKIARAIIAVLLLFDAADTVVWVARVVPEVSALDAVAIVILGARAVVGGLEAMAAWQLLRGGAAAKPLTLIAAAGAAILTTLAVGLDLAPSDVMPGLQTDVVLWYWVVVVLAVLALRKT